MTTITNNKIENGQLVSYDWTIGQSRGSIAIPIDERVSEELATTEYCEQFIERIVSVSDCKAIAATQIVNPLDAAEAHIAAFFSTPRLLQMKVWWDTFPPEDVPKLAAVFDWTTGITVQAAQGNTDFTAPPHTFDELLVEALPFLVP